MSNKEERLGKLTIRPVNQLDLETIVSIEQINFSSKAASKEEMRERIEKIADTFWVAEIDNRVVAYIEGPIITERYLTDDVFYQVKPNRTATGFIAITSLSVDQKWQGQGIGTALLAVFKDLVVARHQKGISLTCQEDRIAYYKMNAFCDEGLSDSKHSGAIWYNMVWENPYFKEKDED